MAYEPDRPPTSIEAVRSTCAKLSPVLRHAVSGPVTREIQTYRQADSRRRDFTELARFPARLVSVGDAVASFNPIHGQGISSAALHTSCLSEYLVDAPQLTRAATEFFDLQTVVTDTAWTMSAGDDATRLDAIEGIDVPEDVARQRWTLEQVLQATLIDPSIAEVSLLSRICSLIPRRWPNRRWSNERLPSTNAHRHASGAEASIHQLSARTGAARRGLDEW